MSVADPTKARQLAAAEEDASAVIRIGPLRHASASAWQLGGADLGELLTRYCDRYVMLVLAPVNQADAVLCDVCICPFPGRWQRLSALCAPHDGDRSAPDLSRRQCTLLLRASEALSFLPCAPHANKGGSMCRRGTRFQDTARRVRREVAGFLRPRPGATQSSCGE